jgi:3-deoxy-7-phosphoheptulonate synthase
MIDLDFSVHRSTGKTHTVLGGVGDEDRVDPAELESLPGVKSCLRIESSFKLAHRHFRPSGTVITVGGVQIGGGQVAIAAGPSSIEDAGQLMRVAEAVASAGGRILRGGIEPMRAGGGAAPGVEELGWLRKAADAHGLLVLTEARDMPQLSEVVGCADLLLLNSRNMQNFRLLAALAESHKPVVLTRGPAATLEELLLSAEYILMRGHYDVILCESGIRTFDSLSGLTLDVGAIPSLARVSHLPVFADPSRGTGRRDRVSPMARAAVAAGADGLLLEVHPDPHHARADGGQALGLEAFRALMKELRQIAPAVDRVV